MPGWSIALRDCPIQSKLRGPARSKTVTKWEEWERIHADEDTRDLNIVITILTIIAVLVAVASMTV
jgi:hypothetical protein